MKLPTRNPSVWQTVQEANRALYAAKESLWINLTFPNKWEIVVLDQERGTTRHKFKKNLSNKQILQWINQWIKEYEMTLVWHNS